MEDILIRTIFIAALIFASLFAQSNFPMTHLSSYLFLPVSAEDEASGGVFLIPQTNPAALSFLNGIDISAGYRYRWGDASDDFLTVAGRFGKYGIFASAGISSVSDIEGREYATSEPEYLFDANRANILLGGAYDFGKNIWVGLAYRHIHEQIEFNTMDANTFSGGITARWRNFYGGISATDYGSNDSFIEFLYPVPTTYRAQVKYSWQFLTAGATFIKPDMLNSYGAIALEISPIDWLNATASYTIMHDSRTFAGGMAFYWKDFSLKYSLSFYGDVGMNHFISLGYRIPLALSETGETEQRDE